MDSELYYFKVYQIVTYSYDEEYPLTITEVPFQSLSLSFSDIVDELRTFIKINYFDDTMYIDLFDNNDKCILSIDSDFLMQLHFTLED